MKVKIADTIGAMTASIRASRTLPIATGFGVATPEQARTVAKLGDAVVVDSAIVNQIAEHEKSPEMVKWVDAFVKTLGDAVKAI